MKKGRKPLDEQIKIQRKLEQLWKGNFLNLNLLEEIQLLNINLPQSKQIFTKDIVLQYKKQKNYRYVKIVTSNLLIDCRSTRLRETQAQKENEVLQLQVDENLQQQVQEPNVEIRPQVQNIQLPPENNFIEQTEEPSIVEILPDQKLKSKSKDNILKPSKLNIQSNNQSVIEVQPNPVTVIKKEILIIEDQNQISNSLLESPQSKTQNPKQQDKIPKYLLFEPSSPNSPSLSFSNSLSQSFVNHLMDESFFGAEQLKLSESLFGNTPRIKQDPNPNQYDQTFAMLKAKINEIQESQFEQLLIAYNHNFLHLQKIILNDINQVKLLISKYQKKKPRII
ncbi:unnamed protein product (macronuclear) [Paramecium tetraurelia]|uniref:Uncharacterized protein n=1 Tax=Paramecium tetraurelia TaxID=5888 RepID=A0E3T5_PARTE|nr:uncharacterized protein GSPATT00023125001 [Paramecium tetraurelia]CAK89952.1 unnamed protein product [Paramecium tetraurelia]|eukprot:XP_001457349.1 hypothetical protein (macronuclear) [Paramecium tetraurelia strain d4-2]